MKQKTKNTIKKLIPFIVSISIVLFVYSVFLYIEKTKDKTILNKYINIIKISQDYETDLIKKTAIIKKGDIFENVMKELGANYNDIAKILKSYKGIFKVQQLNYKSGNKPADTITIYFSYNKILNKKTIEKVIIKKSAVVKIITTKNEEKFTSKIYKEKPIIRIVEKTGYINEGESIALVSSRLNIPYSIIIEFYDTMSFDIDFERDIYPGDKFKFLYELTYSSSGESLGAGSLLYAKIESRQNKEIYKYVSKKKNSFYDKKGRGVAKTIKKTPINKARISSRFSRNRKHPVLGYNRKHKGVDFAAPRGTPIPAGGSGVITRKKWGRGYGNWLEIKHNKKYRTRYAHLKSYAKGIKIGKRVTMGQILGYVGSTGLATGPHLHYEVLKNQMQINPLTMKLPSIERLRGLELKKFRENRNYIDSILKFI